MTLELMAMPGQEQQEQSVSDESSLSLSFIEKRREARYPTEDVAEISILQGGGERVSGRVLDVSRSGLRIEVAAPITKGVHLEILLPRRAIIFGETRYCRRRSSELYHVGLEIEDVYYAQPMSGRHIHDDELGLYLIGKGLTAPEAIQVKSHLVACKTCRHRVAEAETSLHPLTKRSGPSCAGTLRLR